MAAVGSWVERLPARLISPQASLLGCPPIGLATEWISRGTQIEGTPYILGLNAEALRPKFGKYRRFVAQGLLESAGFDDGEAALVLLPER